MPMNWKEIRTKNEAVSELVQMYPDLFPLLKDCFKYDFRLDFEQNAFQIHMEINKLIKDISLIERIMNDYSTIIRQINDKKYGSESFIQEHMAERQKALSEGWHVYIRQLCKEIGFKDEGIVVVPGVNDGQEVNELPYKIIGGDVSSRAIKTALKKYSKNKFLVLSANELPFNKNIFDGYISFRTFSVSGVNMSDSVREAFRVLKPNGKILVSFPVTMSKRFPAKDAEYAIGHMDKYFADIECRRLGIEDMVYGTKKWIRNI